ncbi:hypothetical protein [uncultured Cardiobacterium sp.]|uniref:hypothetical protein n=1 Tax=uncultured Cardiobacterium sp. TaxID=417619 RepID=UPI0026253D02|nr:hypothetical protein [uncultured Cardiobacterium sp.]
MAIHLDNTLQTPVFNSYGAYEMSIFFWVTVAAYITSMFSAFISQDYSGDTTPSDELKGKIFAIVAIVSIFLGHVLYIVTVILVGEQHPSEAYMLMPFAVTSILIFVLL